MLDMLKHYTLEQLQETDIDLLMPLYYWYCKQHSESCDNAPQDDRIVTRGGKQYVVKKANEIGNIF